VCVAAETGEKDHYGKADAEEIGCIACRCIPALSLNLCPENRRFCQLSAWEKYAIMKEKQAGVGGD
ncbi:hypothetical protein, partial [Ruminococcus sp.]|uniref:hypothetical protein n=1 Tax=Ruminococcus sp. TaxID=41978 RepID=UPI003AF89B25